MPDDFEALLKALFEGALASGDIDPITADYTAHKLMEAVYDGFGKSFGEIDYNTPDFNMLKALEKNVFSFSGAKNYHQLRELGTLLKDGDKVRTFEQFRSAALPVLNQFNNAWLRTEYNTAIGSAQMASLWVDFQAGGADSLLQYQTAGDERVRTTHAAIDRTIKPISDKWWDTYYPPNGWNCRCDAVQLNNGTVTASPEYPEIPRMFQVNLAKQDLVFPPSHPYFEGVPKKVLKDYLKSNLPDRNA